jgi:hypothetical protein
LEDVEGTELVKGSALHCSTFFGKKLQKTVNPESALKNLLRTPLALKSVVSLYFAQSLCYTAYLLHKAPDFFVIEALLTYFQYPIRVEN